MSDLSVIKYIEEDYLYRMDDLLIKVYDKDESVDEQRLYALDLVSTLVTHIRLIEAFMESVGIDPEMHSDFMEALNSNYKRGLN